MVQQSNLQRRVKPYHPSTTFNLPATSDIYFRKIDTDTPEIHNFIIGGTPAVDVFVDGTAPTQGEISIDFTGVAQVAAADVGKILTGFYYWISV
ncbi:MAG: hypothetical protein HC908_08980 [Calothrix sp. SM1_7_51]|nr:hypothetical protein [Calothrix sp. SM1_7_51]